MKTYTIIIFLVCQVSLAFGQASFVPENLGSGINSIYDEINPVITPDGRTLFFTRMNHPENKYSEDSHDIWMSTLDNSGNWSAAARVAGLNIGRYNAVLSVSDDGNTVMVNGIYNKKGNIWKKRGVSVVTRTDSGWSAPERLKVNKLSKRNRGLKSSASMSADGQYIVFCFSRSYNSDKTNLFISRKKKNGRWARPIPIRTLNTRANEEAPFLLADNNTLYFASDRNSRGQYDIYRSVRDSKNPGRWTPAVLLNDTINSSRWDSYFRTNKKGSIGYFSSTRQTEDNADIFKVKVFEENPFVIIAGEIRNAKSDRLLSGKPFTVTVNGQPMTEATFSADSGTYKVKLPLRKKYVISAETPDYKGVPDTVDVSDIREFTKVNKNLRATPLPYVLVKGKIVVKSTGDVIPAAVTPKIIIDGAVADSARINTDGTYELKVSHGSRYTVGVNATRFEPVPQLIDLTETDEYKVLAIDLEVDTEKMATISGNIIDKKTGKPLHTSHDVRINVEGLENVYAVVDSLGRYELKLPLGRSYTVNALAQNYYAVYENVDVPAKDAVSITKDLIIVPIEIGQSIRLNNIFFEPAKAVLKQESFIELDHVADFLNENEAIKVEIAGHTDNVGKAALNQKLSLARAKAVTDYIISRGISEDRIEAKGYGMTKPVASNKTKEGKASNRRVEFTIRGK